MSSITVDRTGFPLVRMEAAKLEVHLLPVTKLQFEVFLAEQNTFGDGWYEEVLRANPRCSWRELGSELPQRAFLTGIRPEEARVFAGWLGDGFRLPTVDQWHLLYRVWQKTSVGLSLRRGNLPMDRLVRALLQANSQRPLSEFSYLSGGVLEWVAGKRGWCLLGEPCESSVPNLFGWKRPVFPACATKRCGLFGFRLLRHL